MKIIKEKIDELKNKELFLFNRYNRHFNNIEKLKILEELSTTIKEINLLENLKL